MNQKNGKKSKVKKTKTMQTDESNVTTKGLDEGVSLLSHDRG